MSDTDKAASPMFASSVARRKWEELQADGHRMQRLHFERADGRSGTIDAWGKVFWTAAPPARAPECVIVCQRSVDCGAWPNGACEQGCAQAERAAQAGDELPPLPEPRVREMTPIDSPTGYTASQMRAYALAARGRRRSVLPMQVLVALNQAMGGNEWQGDASHHELAGPAGRAIAALAARGAQAEPLREALREMLEAWEEQFGEGACDCQPEPQNAGHVCQCCKARAALKGQPE